MKDQDSDSVSGRLRGVYGDADEYVEQERGAWKPPEPNEQGARRGRRPRMRDDEHARLLDEAGGFAASDDVSQDEINDLL